MADITDLATVCHRSVKPYLKLINFILYGAIFHESIVFYGKTQCHLDVMGYILIYIY